MIQNNLGFALMRLGEGEGGTERLEQAVAAFRSALKEWTRQRVPLDWSLTKNNLGRALLAIGGQESGTARLEEAVAAYRAALEGWTRKRVPFIWATTQNNLGNALWRLVTERAGRPSSKRRFKPIAKRSRNGRATALLSIGR
jgi:tetratricopeptide (TPR) repeat protein